MLLAALGLLAFLRHSEKERKLAEAARWRAEESEKILSHSLIQLQTLITDLAHNDKLRDDRSFSGYVQSIRKQVGALKYVSSVNTDTLRALGVLERDLAGCLVGKQPRLQEARELLG